MRLVTVAEKLKKLEWPAWATWGMLAVVATSLVTIAAAINDIW